MLRSFKIKYLVVMIGVVMSVGLLVQGAFSADAADVANIANVTDIADATDAADINVYGEGAYTADDLSVYIYADIDDLSILSAGVKLTYNSSELTVLSAKKNEADWYLGDGTKNYAYMEPDISTPGEVIIILGRLDTGNPKGGISGRRVLLGVVKFSLNEGTMPQDPSLSFGLDYAKSGEFKNFVTTDAQVLDDKTDGVAFDTIEIHQRGDANADAVINDQDIERIRDYQVDGGDFNCWMDCNADEQINVLDIGCIKYIQ